MDKSRKIFCNTCKVETHHNLKAVHSRFVDNHQIQPFDLSEWCESAEPVVFGEHDALYQYKFWACRGCDTAVLQESCTLKMMLDEHSDRFFWSYTFHPKRSAEHCSIKNFIDLPPNLWIIYNEVVESFNAQLEILTAVGLRSLLEGICVDKGIDDNVAWGLKAKLKELDKRQHLPSGIVKSLESFKLMGDESVHKLERSSIQNLSLAIEDMESLLDFLYSLDAKADVLLKRVIDQSPP